ncbi:hypothetical protein Tco_0107868, partial [Tanacetum coccineum]
MYLPPQQFTSVYVAPIYHQHQHTLVNPQQQSVSLQPFISPPVTQLAQAEFPQLDSGLAVPIFQQGEDPIDCINKAIAFLYFNKFNKFKEDKLRVLLALETEELLQPQGETMQLPKRPRSSTWFKEKLILAEAQEVGQILDEEQLAFIADPGIAEVQVSQQTIPHNSVFQTEDLDAYDSDCDD